MLPSMWSQKVGHDLATEQQQLAADLHHAGNFSFSTKCDNHSSFIFPDSELLSSDLAFHCMLVCFYNMEMDALF